MKPFLSLVFVCAMVCYCGWIAGLVGQWVFEWAGPDAALFMGCVTGVAVTRHMWKTLMDEKPTGPPSIQR